MKGMMKAARKVRREPGMDLVDTPIPTIQPNEVLVKVGATAICGSDMMIKGEDPSHIAFGDTLGDGKTRDGFPDKKFHYMLSNPPFGVEWKPEEDVVTREHEDLGFNGRFGPGLPRINDAMPPLEASGAERRALAEHLATLHGTARKGGSE